MELNTIRYDTYLLQLGFHLLAVVLKLVQKAGTDIYTRKNNTAHRTQEIESKTYETKQNKRNNKNLNWLKQNKDK